MSTFESEVRSGKRFEFGKNWRSFLATLNEERIEEARKSLREMLGVETLAGKTWLDIGSGSGLFSLAARSLGAKVHSFDFDPDSVACTRELKARYFPDDPDWTIEEGSVLDRAYIESLGHFDVVYSWGVLHHTGDMWTALANAESRVADGGVLFIALYNDQGGKSAFWKKVKEIYCAGPLGKVAVSGAFLPYYVSRTVAESVVKRRNLFADYKRFRGMSMTHDWFDWLGGLPFEVASVETIFEHFRDKGYTLRNIRTTNSLGNNQFVFVKGA